MKKPKILVILLLISVLFVSACNQTKYVCPDGSNVNNPNDCNNKIGRTAEVLSENDYLDKLTQILKDSSQLQGDNTNFIKDYNSGKIDINNLIPRIEEKSIKRKEYLEKIRVINPPEKYIEYHKLIFSSQDYSIKGDGKVIDYLKAIKQGNLGLSNKYYNEFKEYSNKSIEEGEKARNLFNSLNNAGMNIEKENKLTCSNYKEEFYLKVGDTLNLKDCNKEIKLMGINADDILIKIDHEEKSISLSNFVNFDGLIMKNKEIFYNSANKSDSSTWLIISSEDASSEITRQEIKRFSGNSDTVTDEFYLEPGLYIFKMEHFGESNFQVQLLDGEGNTVGYLANKIGKWSGSISQRIDYSGYYRVQVQLGVSYTGEGFSSNANWQISVEK